MTLRERVAAMPAAGQFVVVALVVVAVVLVLSAARGHPSLLTALIVGVVVSAVATPVMIARRAVRGRIRLEVEVTAAVRSGLLPVTLDRPRWRTALAARHTWALRFLVLGTVLVVAAAGLAVWAVLSDDLRLDHSLSAGLFGVGGVWVIVSSIRQLRRVGRLRDRLESGYREVIQT